MDTKPSLSELEEAFNDLRKKTKEYMKHEVLNQFNVEIGEFQNTKSIFFRLQHIKRFILYNFTKFYETCFLSVGKK